MAQLFEPLVSAIANRITKTKTNQMEIAGMASSRNDNIPLRPEEHSTQFLGKRSASHPKISESGTPRNSRNPKIKAAVCSSIPFHTIIEMMCRITPALAVSLRMLPDSSSQ